MDSDDNTDYTFGRIVYDLFFNITVVVILINLISGKIVSISIMSNNYYQNIGLIIDTFGLLRDEE